jgi:hypothetical protein
MAGLDMDRGMTKTSDKRPPPVHALEPVQFVGFRWLPGQLSCVEFSSCKILLIALDAIALVGARKNANDKLRPSMHMIEQAYLVCYLGCSL